MMSESTGERRRRGRPPGPSEQGLATRRRLYDTAIRLIAERGWPETTLRDIAAAAGVSVGLLYRYFPSKRAVVLALYDELSSQYAAGVVLPSGAWRDRFLVALRASLATLEPHRPTLAALVGVLVGDPAEGLFAPATAFSRWRVQAVFELAATGATDAPRGDRAAALGRLLYLAHLGILLWWLLDRSPGQRATRGLIGLSRPILRLIAVALRLPGVGRIVLNLDALVREGLFGELSPPDASS